MIVHETHGWYLKCDKLSIACRHALSNPGNPLKDWVAYLEGANHAEIYMAEVLFVMIAYPMIWDKPSCTIPEDERIPIRLAICNLYNAHRLTAYPGAGVWDVNIRADKAYHAFPVEFGLLQEKLLHMTMKDKHGMEMTRLCRCNHQSMRARGRNWRWAPSY